jgi:hypothetical protein
VYSRSPCKFRVGLDNWMSSRIQWGNRRHLITIQKFHWFKRICGKYGLAAIYVSGKPVECLPDIFIGTISNKWQSVVSICFCVLASCPWQHVRSLAFSCCAKRMIYYVSPFKSKLQFVASFHSTTSPLFCDTYINILMSNEGTDCSYESRDKRTIVDV